MQYRVGDRVHLSEKSLTLDILRGKIGTVVDVAEEGTQLSIEFPFKFPFGHGCSGRGKNGHCRYFYMENHRHIKIIYRKK